jgi:hypothetical protein
MAAALRALAHQYRKSGQEGFGNRKPDRFRGFDIDDQLELNRLLNRQITRLLALDDAIDIRGRTPNYVDGIRSIRDQRVP